MFDLLMTLYSSIVVLISGVQGEQKNVPIVSVSPTAAPQKEDTNDVAEPQNNLPKATAIPQPTKIISASLSPQPTVFKEIKNDPRIYPTVFTVTIPSKNDFIPRVKIGSFRPGAGNCTSNPSGTYTFEISDYNEADNITGVKIKGTAYGLSPNTQYVLNVGSSHQMGGRLITTDSQGSVSFDIQDSAYTVHYEEIYSLSIDDPDKLFPNNACLIDDLTQGRG